MNRTIHYFTFFLLIMTMNRPATAAAVDCLTYSNSLKANGIEFDVSSRPISDCSVHIVTVTVRRGGRKIAVMKSDVDYLARSASAVDLTGDGKPELVVSSLTAGGVPTEALDVYWMDGATLRRAMVPELDDKGGYKGGDRFNLAGRQIVRVIPVYSDGDSIDTPTGGTRSLRYEFKSGSFTPVFQTVKAAGISDVPKVRSAAQSVQPTQPAVVATQPAVAATQPSVAANPAVPAAVPAAVAVAVKGVRAVKTGIEIGAIGRIQKYKVMKLENPERIAIDIPDAVTSLSGRTIPINRFNIGAVRVGRNNGFVRVVLDTTLARFPKHQVTSSATGILVTFKK